MELYYLIPVIFLSAVLSGAFSMGGGILALASFSTVMDTMTLIPFHGIIQLSSNLSRTLLAWKHVSIFPVLYFALGTGIGAPLGRFFLLNLPSDVTAVIFAVGIIFFTWKPQSMKPKKKIKGNYIIAGGLSGYFALILGVSGPIVAPFYLHDTYTKEGLVATKSASQIFTHAFKIGVFLSLGRVSTDMFRSALVFIPFIMAGNWTGQKLLGKLPEKSFMLIIRIMITFLAVRMFAKAL